jgi:hypothetical protein
LRIIEKTLPYDSRSDATWYLVPLGDVHRGNRNFDEDRFYKTIEFVKNEPHAIVLGMGDYSDCISAQDRRHDYNAIDKNYLTPDSQYEQVTKDLMPIKDKIIGLLDGNHDYTFWQRHNHNYVDYLAKDLGTEYAGISAYVRLRFRRVSETGTRANLVMNLYAHHGWTGSRTDSYKVKTIQDLATIFPGLHGYLMGHVHQIGEAPPTISLYVDNSGKIREWSQKYIFTGSYIKGYEEGIGSYVEARAYRPTSLGSPIIEIKPNRPDRGRDDMVPPFSIRVSSLDFMS